MTTWEYFGLENSFYDEARFNELGAEGWELIGFGNGSYIFKRAIAETEPPPEDPPTLGQQPVFDPSNPGGNLPERRDRVNNALPGKPPGKRLS